MKKTLVFATGNPNKVREVRELIGEEYELKSLKDIGCEEDIPETEPTLEGNALLKARYVKEHYGLDCFSEDTGLEIHALNGEPGVYTARYAGAEKDPQANMDKALRLLQDKDDRSAQFRTVVALIMDGKEHLFEGVAKGTIAKEKLGEKGFGYDPVFVPAGHGQSFAQMDADLKNSLSHRGKAIKKLQAFLQQKQ